MIRRALSSLTSPIISVLFAAPGVIDAPGSFQDLTTFVDGEQAVIKIIANSGKSSFFICENLILSYVSPMN